MKKIGLYIGIAPHMGGVYQYSLSLLKALAALPQDEYEVLVSFCDPNWNQIAAEFEVRTVQTSGQKWSLGLGAMLTWTGCPIKFWQKISVFLDPIAKILRQQDADLWIFSAHSCVSYQMPVAAVAPIHDLMHRYERQFPESGSCLTFIWRERVFKRICENSTGILVDSALGKNHVLESYRAESQKIHVLPFVAPEYQLETAVNAESAHALPTKFLFYPAQLWLHKNHANLLRAVAEVKRDHAHIHLVLAGSGKNNAKQVHNMVAELGLTENVTFLGYVTDAELAMLYRKARALIMPTFFGPTNIPPLEAFALGCPVAVSNIYGMPAQVGDAALLFDPNDVHDLAACMGRLWVDDDLCQTLRARGLQRHKEWNQTHFNRRFRDIMEALL